MIADLFTTKIDQERAGGRGNTLAGLARWLFPGICVLCRGPARESTLCSGCAADLPRARIACPRCADPVESDGLCWSCRRQPPVFAAAVVPLLYQAPVTMLIRRLKFHHDLALVPALARLVAESAAPRYDTLPDVIVPVPLHWRRLSERGYNQAFALARWIGRALRVPVDHRAARRTRMGATQSRLATRAARRKNLHSAFSGAGLTGGKHVAIVDDVLTTAATASALAVALLDDGARRVDVWTCARTPRDER